MDYKDFKVLNCPSTAFYIPNFISPAEETLIINYVNNAPKPKWTQLSHRRLINYGGIPHKNGMIAEEIPKWLQNYVEKVNNLGAFDDKKANHVLINEYLAGNGIMPHLDGSLFYPTITTISCGSHTVIQFTENDQRYDDSSIEQDCVGGRKNVVCKLLVEPRSLLILKDDLYNTYLHGIEDIKEDILDEGVCNLNSSELKGNVLERGKRISLTIRHVPKTSSVKIRF